MTCGYEGDQQRVTLHFRIVLGAFDIASGDMSAEQDSNSQKRSCSDR